MPTVSELSVVVNADVSPAESKLTSFGSGLGSALSVGIGAASAAIGAAVVTGVNAAGDLEQAVANISTIKPEIDTSAVFGALNEMSTRIPQSADQLGDSLYNVFSSMDVGTEQALALVETFAKGAVGAQTDAETFGTAIMGALNAYKLSADDAAHVSDVFFNAINKGVITGEELAASLGPVTQSAKAAGVGIDELGAMIAAVTREGGPAAQNVNNLNNFLQKITTKEAQKQLEELGIATKTATGEFRPTTDVLEDLKARLGGMTEAARANALQAIFPDAQARIGAQTLLSQLDLVKSATEENRDASGVAEEAYRKMSETFNSQSQLLKNSLMSVLTTIGAAILPAITPLIAAFAEQLPGAFDAAKTALAPLGEILMSQVVPALQGFLGIVGQVATFLGQHLEIVAGFGAALLALAGVAVVAGAIGAVAAAIGFLLSPLGLVAVAVGVLTAAWVGNWGGIQEKTRAVIDALVPLIQGALAAIQQFWQVHGDTIIRILENLWTIVSTGFQNSMTLISGLIKAGAQLWQGDWEGAWQTLTDTAKTVWDNWGVQLKAALDILDALFGPAFEAIGATIEGALDSIGSALQGAWDGFTTTIKTALDAIRSAIQAVWNLIPEDIRADLELIAGHLTTKFGEFVTTSTTKMEEIKTAIATAWQTIQTTTGTILDAIGTVIKTAWDAAAAVTRTTWDAILAAIRGPVEQARIVVSGMADSILGILRGLISTAGAAAASIGSAIVEGIRGAVMRGAQSIASAAAAAVRGALNAAKAAAGIDSPSKVFAEEVGRPIGEGILAGLAQIGPQIDGAMARLMRPPAGLAPAAATGMGDVIDYDRLAAAIARTLPRGGNTYVLQGTPEQLLSELERRARRADLLLSARGPR